MKILKILNEKFFSKSKSEANKLEKDFHNYLSRFVVNIFSVEFTLKLNYSSRYKEGHQKEASKFGSYKEIKYVETGLSKHLFFGE